MFSEQYLSTKSDAEICQQEKYSLKKAIIRALIFLISVIFCGYCIFLIREDIYYFTASNMIDLGDLRLRYLNGERELTIENNSYVSFSNVLVTNRARHGNVTYFYCPLFNLVVQTRKDIPKNFGKGALQVPEGLLDLLYSHTVKPEEFATTFSGKGRFFNAEWFQSHYPKLLQFYAQIIKPDKVYFISDGETPETFYPYILAFIFGLAGLIYSLIMFIKTIMRLLIFYKMNHSHST